MPVRPKPHVSYILWVQSDHAQCFCTSPRSDWGELVREDTEWHAHWVCLQCSSAGRVWTWTP